MGGVVLDAILMNYSSLRCSVSVESLRRTQDIAVVML
jgi:hypothetical protein